MTPEQWQRIEGLFAEVADLQGEQREQFLAALDAETASELRQLLATDTLTGNPIALAIEGVAGGGGESAKQPGAAWQGRRMGAYVIDREIGRGGMGVVFEAHREDARFEQRVALKVALNAAFTGPRFRERFLAERRILAQLEHPNIARLLDGGETEEGLPFFALEYVEGIPIHRYAAGKNLGIREKLELFLQLCGAVEYAHGHLVVHRDIKPANILVTADGVPKLLDFGVAKLLDSEFVDGQTQTGFAPMTPDYCSPEQLRNQHITTRTDVYLLGLLLHELLANEKAQHANPASPVALEKSVCETEIPLPSARAAARGDRALARLLEGDLDTIVATATRKEQRERYASVALLAADIRLHLAGMPITSRPAGWWYRASKFVARNKLAVSLSAIAASALLAGVFGTVYQARRAERRFAQVRGIAHALMYQVHDSIRFLPNSLEAQQIVMKTALDYLDNLLKEGAGDEDLLAEIASGYVRIGNIEGSNLMPSRSETGDATATLRKADAILLPLLRRNPMSEMLASIFGEARASIAENYARNGRSEEGLAMLQETDRMMTPVALRPGSGFEVRRVLGLVRMTITRDFADSANGVQYARNLLEVQATLEAEVKRRKEALHEVAVGNAVAGGVFLKAGQRAEALPLLQRAVQYQQEASDRDPTNVRTRRSLMLAHAKLADLYMLPGPTQNKPLALQGYARMADEAQAMYRSDPLQKTHRLDFGMSLIRYSEAFPPAHPKAVEQLQRGVQILTDLAGQYPDDTDIARYLSDAHVRVGIRSAQAKDRVRARAAFQKAIAIAEQQISREPTFGANRQAWLRAHMEFGKFLAANREMAALQSVIGTVEKGAPPDMKPRIDKWRADISLLAKQPD